MKKIQKHSDPIRDKKYLNISEVVAEYGNSIGFWRKKIFYRQIPFIKAGRSVKIAREDLDAWHVARRVQLADLKPFGSQECDR
jgi:hypothetical protein